MSTKLKKLVEARQAKTHEGYAQALRHVREAQRSQASPADVPRIVARRATQLSLWAPDQNDDAGAIARMVADRQRRNAAAILAQQDNHVPPPRRMPSFPDQDDQSAVVARMAADRQRRNVAAIVVAQQNNQVLPPLAPTPVAAGPSHAGITKAYSHDERLALAPEVGMGLTLELPRLHVPFTIIQVLTPRKIVVQEDAVAGVQVYQQEWDSDRDPSITISRDPSGETVTLSKRKSGKWAQIRERHGYYLLGERSAMHMND